MKNLSGIEKGRLAGGDTGQPYRPSREMRGYTLTEMLMVVAILLIIVGTAVPSLSRFIVEYRLRAATTYLRSLMRQVRAHAVTQRNYIGLVFDEVEGEPELAIYVDRNGNGIRRADIRHGRDVLLREAWRLTDLYPGVRYGALPEGAAQPFPGLRIGRARILSFSPLGQSTSGTIFLSNDNGSIYAVVLFGVTGRVRVVRYRNGKWVAV